MLKKINRSILKLIPHKISDYVFYNHPQYKKQNNGYVSFSQEGEDMVLRKIFSDLKCGFYIDIGAHHPSLFSNTNYFYQHGWTGINIEPIPGSKAVFDKERTNDINLEMLISEDDGPVDFYIFEPSLMNTMSKTQAEKNKHFSWCELIKTIPITSMPLGKILDKYLPANIKINFMSIDVEGAELSVLKSNDWDKYKPEVILVEFIDINIVSILKTEVHHLLSEHFYSLFAKTGNTAFYKQSEFTSQTLG